MPPTRVHFARSCDACLSKVAEDGVAACSWYWRWFCLQSCFGICRLVGTQCWHLYVVKAQVGDVTFALQEVFLYLLLVSNIRRSITKLSRCINEERTLLSPRLPTNFRTGWSAFASSPHPHPHHTRYRLQYFVRTRTSFSVILPCSSRAVRDTRLTFTGCYGYRKCFEEESRNLS